MHEKNSILTRALVRLCPKPEDYADRLHWERLLLGKDPDLDWLQQQLPAFLAGPPDALNCFIAGAIFLRYYYTVEEAFECQARLGGSRAISAKDDPQFHLRLFKTVLGFVRQGLPYRENNPMRHHALIYSALVAAGAFVGGEKGNLWQESPGDSVIRNEMNLRGMCFATLALDGRRLVANATHSLLHPVRLVIPNTKSDGTVKVPINGHRDLTLQDGSEVIYFMDVVDRFHTKKPREPKVTMAPVATLRALRDLHDRTTAVFPTCPFVG